MSNSWSMKNRLKKRSICKMKDGQVVKLTGKIEFGYEIIWYCKVWLWNSYWSKNNHVIRETDIEKVHPW